MTKVPERPQIVAQEQLLEQLHSTAFAIAYRMLGSVSEAEDVVQEALLRVHRALERGEDIESPPAYVATVTTRLAIDELAPRAPGARPTPASGCPRRSSPTRRTIPLATPRWPIPCRWRS